MLNRIVALVVFTMLTVFPVGEYDVLETEYNSITEASERIGYEDCLTLSARLPHNSSSFTQGLFFHGGELYESTGLYGESSLYKNADISTGEYETEYDFPDEIFAEGAVVFNQKLYVLTYKENTVFVFDPETLEHENTLSYGRQGWGLTTDNEYLIASDGSSTLYFMDEQLKDIRTLTVTRDGKEVERINELEYIDGNIWANVWLTEEILVIDKETGAVIRTIDFSGLYKHESDDINDVLNGIAYNRETGKLYITGKRWDTMFEFELK